MSAPKLIIWDGRGLYLGAHPVLLKKYTVTSDQLVVCLSGELVLSDGDEILRAKTILLRAGTEVLMDFVDGSNAITSFIYLHPLDQDYHALKQDMQLELQGTHFHHRNEAEIIRILTEIRDRNDITPDLAYEMIAPLLKPSDPENFTPVEFDPRVIKVVQRLKLSSRDNLPMKTLADEVHLSESRLVKLFKEQIGVPITRFRLRYRIFVGVLHMAVGRSVTEAAIAAGFSSTAHFSKCYTATMGTQLSASFLKPPYVQVLIDPKILAVIKMAYGDWDQVAG